MTQTLSFTGKNRRKSSHGSNRRDLQRHPGMKMQGMRLNFTENNRGLGYEHYYRIANLRHSILEIFNQPLQNIATQLLELDIEDEDKIHICNVLLDYCAEGHRLPVYYSKLAQKLCSMDEVHRRNFENSFIHYYRVISNSRGGGGDPDWVDKICNVAKLFGLLLSYDTISWSVFSCVQLTEKDLTKRAAFKYLRVVFEVLSSVLEIPVLKERFDDATMYEDFQGLFPIDTPQNTKFAIKFYNSINLPELTEKLHKYLAKRKYVVQVRILKIRNVGSSSSSDSEGNVSDDENAGKNKRNKGNTPIKISNN